MYLFHFVPVIPFLSPVIWCPKTSLSKGYLLLFIFTDCTYPSQHLLEALVRALLPTEISSSPSITKFRPFVMPLEMVFPPLPREVRSKLQSANSSGSLQGLKMHRTRKRCLGSRCCSATLWETGSSFCVWCWKGAFPVCWRAVGQKEPCPGQTCCSNSFLTISDRVWGIAFIEHGFKQHGWCTSWKHLEGGGLTGNKGNN